MNSHHHQHPALRLTPSNSPFSKPSNSRSPLRPALGRYEESGLRLQKVIGTTTSTANAFDCLPSANQFAFTAGAAAVLSTIQEDLSVTQNFYRANWSAPLAARDGNGSWPLSPTPSEPRHRTVGTLKDHSDNRASITSSQRDWSDSPGRTISAKDRVKAATSVALSPDGKWLALGETGYKPRVLLFSTKDGSSESPACAIAEHTFGVHALRFSPDSRSLASLGTVNDGFLYIWNIDDRTGAATLSASNKCTTLIHSMTWMGRSIVTVGLRFVKVWRPDDDPTIESRQVDSLRGNASSTPRQRVDHRSSDFGNSILSPKHRALAGKNSLLNELLETSFTSVLALSDTKAIVCAESGEVCLLDDSEKAQSLVLAERATHKITAARFDASRSHLTVTGEDGEFTQFSLQDLEYNHRSPSRPSSSSGSPIKPAVPAGPVIVAAAATAHAVVEVTSDRCIRLTRAQIRGQEELSVSSRRLAAHQDSVLGTQPLQSAVFPSASFLTFSGRGTVHLWDIDGISVTDPLRLPIEDSPAMCGLPNELKAVTTLCDGSLLASGDKYGTVALLDIRIKAVTHRVRAHSAEVLDLLSFQREGTHYLASASRDRTIQLFVCLDAKLELLQTMDEHAGAVTGLRLSLNGDQLLSCSSDRSVVVRHSLLREMAGTRTLAFGMLRTIALKSSPTSIATTAENDSILISSSDRCITKYNIRNGQVGFSFKCSDPENGEAVAMSKILYAPSFNGNPAIVGISSSDKSVRLYSESGSLVARDFGHTEGVTDVTLARRASEILVTVAADSTIFLWTGVSPGERAVGQEHTRSENHTTTLAAPLGPPLRKVLSHSEMYRFRREKSIEEESKSSPYAVPPTSPQKLRKKTSKISFAQTPKLDPNQRSNCDKPRRSSLYQRSPSPPSPRNTNKKDHSRRQTLGMSLKSKSSENVVHSSISPGASNPGFGSMTASTESVCRTLRAYRRKLVSHASTDSIPPEALRELEKELKLTARAVGERSQGKGIDEALMSKLLEQASEKIVDLLDQRLKARVESPVVNELPETSQGQLGPPGDMSEHLDEARIERADTAPGALQTQRTS